MKYESLSSDRLKRSNLAGKVIRSYAQCADCDIHINFKFKEKLRSNSNVLGHVKVRILV